MTRMRNLPKTFTALAGVAVEIDPNDQFEGIENHKLYEACGLIPDFVFEAALSDPRNAEEFLSLVREIYGFSVGGNWLEEGNGTLDSETMVYSYPEDPDMHPLVTFVVPTEEGDVKCGVYQYGYFVVVAEDFQHLERMD